MDGNGSRKPHEKAPPGSLLRVADGASSIKFFDQATNLQPFMGQGVSKPNPCHCACVFPALSQVQAADTFPVVL